MESTLLFYGIDEYTDDAKYYKKKGMIPFKFEIKTLDNKIYKSVIQYSYKGHLFDVLEEDQCYSGYMITLMRLPKLSFEELLDTALISKKDEERAGAIGIILKEHPIEFEKYLRYVKNTDIKNIIGEKNVKRIAILIYDHIRLSTSYVRHLDRIMELCKEVKLY